MAVHLQPGEPPASPGSAASAASLDQSLMSGMAWTGAFKWATQVLSWASTLIIARILSPSDYGLMAMATVYLGFIGMVNEFGLSAAIIRNRELTEDQISALGGISVALSFAVWILSAGLATPIAWLYKEQAVRWIIIVLGFTFLTTGLKVLPRALLIRDLQFKRAAAIDAVEGISATAFTLALALLGFRYWSLVLGGVASGVLSCLLALRWRPHRRHLPASLESVKASLLFGWHLVVSRFAWYIYSNADVAIIGRMFDKVVLGGYGLASNLAHIPVTRISSLVSQVTPAILSAVQHDPAQLRRYMLRLTEGLAFITFPFAIGMALVAREFVLVVLGEHWIPAIVPLQLLSILAGLRSITTLHPQLLNAVGRSRDLMRFSLLALVVMPPLFVLGGTLAGPAGIAWAWLIGYSLVVIPLYRSAFAVTGLTWPAYLRSLWPAMLASAGMAAAVLGVGTLIPQDTASIQVLGLEVGTGVLSYGVLIFGLQRKRIRELWTTFRALRQ